MKKVLIWLMVLIIATSLALIGVGCKEEPVKEAVEEENMEEAVEEEAMDPANVKIRVVYHGTSLLFAQLINAGVVAAQEELGADVKMVGPIESNVDEQVAIIEDLIIQEVDGIATTNVNSEAFNPVIKRAIDAGIPVVEYNSQPSGEKSVRLAFIGQSLKESGREAARILVEYMGEKGKVAITTGDAAAAWSQDRESGVREILDQYPNIEVVSVTDAGWEEQAMYAACENTLLSKELDGIISLDCCSTYGMGRAIRAHEMVGELVHIGYDLFPETLENIDAGATQATLGQEPFLQGYVTVMELYEHIVNGKPLEDIWTDIYRCDDSNVAEWLEKVANGELVG